MHVRRVATDAETLERLRHGFAERFLLEEAQHARLDALRADVRALDALADGGTPAVPVRGARFFAAAGSCPPDDARVDGTTDDVARAIEQRHPGLLAQRRAATDAALGELTWPRDDGTSGGDAARPFEPRRFVAEDAPVVARAADLLAASLALDVLCTGTPLRSGALRADLGAVPDERGVARDDAAEPPASGTASCRDGGLPPDAPCTLRNATGELLRLGDGERQALRAFALALRERASGLAASRRPDWGGAMLLVLARLAAVDESLATGHLVVLDAYPSDVTTLPPDEVRAHQAALPGLLRESGAQLAAARRPLAGGRAPREIEYSALEAAVNRNLELSDASLHGAALRLAPGPLVVSGDALTPLPPRLAIEDRSALLEARDAARARLAAYQEGLLGHDGYDLLSRNCVSELFREIARALPPDPARPDAAGDGDDAFACDGSRVALGGCIDPARQLRFIPFVSAAAVDREYRVTAREDVPSRRSAALAAMRTDEDGILVALRESNVVSSTLYRARDEDSVFLFFTDDLPALRPVLGVANLATGVGATVAGLASLPADGGTLLGRGLRGTLFSVPELGFVSIRKGTFAWAPRADDEGAR